MDERRSIRGHAGFARLRRIQAGLLRSALPRWLVAAADWSTLRPESALLVDAGLGVHEGDLLFSVMSTAEKLMTKGKAEILIRQLRRRFGNLPTVIEQRVLSASVPELELWADRSLDAATLDAVFAAE